MRGKTEKKYHYFIGSRKWRVIREAKLKQTPYCEVCSERGLMVPAVLVHHIIPIQYGRDKRQMRSLTFRPKNLQSLCRQCHVEIHRQLRMERKKAEQTAEQNNELKVSQNV